MSIKGCDPVLLTIFLLKIFGAFPFCLEINGEYECCNLPICTKRRKKCPEEFYEERHKSWSITLVRSIPATIWSVFLLLLSCICFGYFIYVNYLVSIDPESVYSSDNVIWATLFLTGVISFVIILIYCNLYSNKLKTTVFLLVRALGTDRKFIRLRFFKMHIIVIMDLVCFLSLMVPTLFDSETVSTNLDLYLLLLCLTIVFVILPPLSFVTTGCLIYSTVKCMAMKLDYIMQNYIDRYFVEDNANEETGSIEQSVNPILLKLRQKAKITMVSLNKRGEEPSRAVSVPEQKEPITSALSTSTVLSDKDRECEMLYLHPSKFLRRLDLIMSNLSSYAGVLIIITISFNMIFTVCFIYHALNIETVYWPLKLTCITLLIKTSFILCTTDDLMLKRNAWLQKLRYIKQDKHGDEILEKAKIDVVMDQLEHGVELIPYGLFVMDRRCLIPIMSTILTYVIIAVQFRLGEMDPSKQKGTTGNSSIIEETNLANSTSDL